ncbi:hypothetical protein KBB59_01255 [Candidatus Woesebacteria bacterium]|jgi:uncharacterized protein YpmB|nr:hypothetical protein [Candidatus Woesebacteria bacterium]HOA11988.1 hypothetical protein [Candidatus Woesebacteria bacterium]HOI05250.1 hypothetical protein [Candidatus Woesebacteria bacterium]HOP39083.1 hypothetical protein [Candidatus Woesebacteria bacterium]HPA61914.1 hypothetical protein [Candidatus Woesebacteria bacterium]
MINQKNFNRLVFFLLIMLALAAGYFQSALETQERRYQALDEHCQKLELMLTASNSAQLELEF